LPVAAPVNENPVPNRENEGFPGRSAVPLEMVAAIATAGMVQPLLTPLGIGDENGRALATLAVGAGAMTVSHVNDEYFWLVAAGGRPAKTSRCAFVSSPRPALSFRAVGP